MPAKTLLDLDEDVLYLICRAIDLNDIRTKFSRPSWNPPFPSLLNLCATCRRLREAGAPFLYRKSSISDQYKTVSHRPSEYRWMEYMENCEPLRRHLRFVNFDKQACYERAATRLAQLLPRFPHLRSLRLDTSKGSTVEPFIKTMLTCDLPQIECLDVPGTMVELVPHFRSIAALRLNVNILDGGRAVSTMQTYITEGRLSRLRYLEMPGLTNSTPFWTAEFLEDINMQVPNLESLGVVCGYSKSEIWFEDLVAQLAKFPRLKALSTMRLESLSMIDYRNAGCDECLHTSYNVSLCGRHKAAAGQFVRRLIFNSCPKLETLWMGESGEFTCRRDEQGQLHIKGTVYARLGHQIESESPFTVHQNM